MVIRKKVAISKFIVLKICLSAVLFEVKCARRKNAPQSFTNVFHIYHSYAQQSIYDRFDNHEYIAYVEVGQRIGREIVQYIFSLHCGHFNKKPLGACVSSAFIQTKTSQSNKIQQIESEFFCLLAGVYAVIENNKNIPYIKQYCCLVFHIIFDCKMNQCMDDLV